MTNFSFSEIFNPPFPLGAPLKVRLAVALQYLIPQRENKIEVTTNTYLVRSVQYISQLVTFTIY